MAMSFGKGLAIVKDFAGVVALVGTAIVGIGTYFGIGVTLPFAYREEVITNRTIIEAVQKQQEVQIQATQKQTCIILQLLRDRYIKEQLDAQEELNKNPTSPTLQRARDEAKANVEYFDAEQRIARCRRLQAPISSSTERNQTDRPSISVHSIRWAPLKP